MLLGAYRRRSSLGRGLSTISFRRSVHKVTSAERTARRELLEKVYAPFNGLDTASQKYQELADSGKVWEDYFRPYDIGPYRAFQEADNVQKLLAEIDVLQKLMKPRVPDLARLLVAEYAHQSVVIENNAVKFGDSLKVYDLLTEKVFKTTQLSTLRAQDLSTIPSPRFRAEGDSSDVNELKNHFIISQWIAETAPKGQGSSGLNEEDLRSIVSRAVQGIEGENVFALSWGGRVPLGEYRRSPIGVRSNPLRIFPYPDEVPACMNRFFLWREEQHRKKVLHPLVLACHQMVYFAYIHPFPDGNGRTSRVLMHDYLVRQGYLPVVFQDLDRDEYVGMVSDAQDGMPEDFLHEVLRCEYEELMTFWSRQYF